MDYGLLQSELVRDEGKVPHVYLDSLGFYTIGVGRLVDSRRGGKLSEDEIQYLLKNDIASHWQEAKTLDCYSSLDTDTRQRAMVNLVFQLGISGLSTFKNFLGYCKVQNWASAGKELRNSLLYKQTPERCERIAKQIELG